MNHFYSKSTRSNANSSKCVHVWYRMQYIYIYRSRERVSMLSDMIKGIKESRKQTVDVNVMLIKNENDSLKSDLEDTRQK